jgi:Protein of unknown function (DUF2971)
MKNESGIVPDYVYKYQAANKNNLNALENGYLYFPSPIQLDDPFDCLPSYEFDGSAEENRPFLGIAHDIGQGIQLVRKQFGVLSLSFKNDSILMWSSYAEGHKGFCLKFRTHELRGRPYFAFEESNFVDTETTNIKCFPINKVDYDSKMPEPIRDFQVDEMDRFLLTKHTDWKYQEECRVVIPFQVLRGDMGTFMILCLSCFHFPQIPTTKYTG